MVGSIFPPNCRLNIWYREGEMSFRTEKFWGQGVCSFGISFLRRTIWRENDRNFWNNSQFLHESVSQPRFAVHILRQCFQHSHDFGSSQIFHLIWKRRKKLVEKKKITSKMNHYICVIYSYHTCLEIFEIFTIVAKVSSVLSTLPFLRQSILGANFWSNKVCIKSWGEWVAQFYKNWK